MVDQLFGIIQNSQPWKWLTKTWWGLLVTYGALSIGVYSLFWKYGEPAGSKGSSNNILLGICIGAHLTLFLELFFRANNWIELTEDKKRVLSTVERVHTHAFEGNNNEFLKIAKRIDMAAVTLRGLHAVRWLIRDGIIKNNTEVRVALLDPECDAWRLRATSGTEDLNTLIAEHNTTRKAIREINEHIEDVNKAGMSQHPQPLNKVKLYYYTFLPYCGCIITDEMVRYWPYLVRTAVGNSPTFDITRTDPQGIFSNFFVKHFNHLLESEVSNP